MDKYDYYCKEAYELKYIFTQVPVPQPDEAIVLTDGVSENLLIRPTTSPRAIRAGKYTKIVRVKTGPKTISGELYCYCKQQVYQFRIYYKTTCQVCDPMAVVNAHFPDMRIMSDEFYQNLFDTAASNYDMRDSSLLQQQLLSELRESVQIEDGLQVGPLRSLQVKIDEDYRNHLRLMQKDTETVEAEIHRMKNSDELSKLDITEKSALLRLVLDGKKTVDEVLQESRQRKIENYSQFKIWLTEMNELRKEGLIDEALYQNMVQTQSSQLTFAASIVQTEKLAELYAPDAED